MTEKILHLTLMRKWFDEILAGTKKIEYREIKPYWTTRLFEKNGKPRNYDFIIFKNGYSKDAPKMKVEFKEIRTNKKTKQYELLLGKVVSSSI